MSVTLADLERFEAEFGNAGRALSRLIRPAIMPPPGNVILSVDESQIEARVLPWLAGTEGAERKLDIFRETDVDPTAPDIYKRTAAGTYGVEPHEVTKAQRQTGKVQELALGFAGGEGALMAMAAVYRMALTREQAKPLADIWRANNQWATDFWADVQLAFDKAHDRPGQVFTVGRLGYMFDPDYLGGTMFCALPDGRLLSYPFLRMADITKTDKFGQTETSRKLTYLSKGNRRVLWKGILVENATQAAAASILRAKIVEAERELPGLVIGHTHDELIGECGEDEAEEKAAALKAIMERALPWTDGLPLRADAEIQPWYSKVEE